MQVDVWEISFASPKFCLRAKHQRVFQENRLSGLDWKNRLLEVSKEILQVSRNKKLVLWEFQNVRTFYALAWPSLVGGNPCGYRPGGPAGH